MRFKIDENLPRELCDQLQAAGHDSLSVLDQNLGGSADESIADVCRREARVLMTLDIDFADIRTYPPGNYAGIIVLRLSRQDRHRVLDAVERLLPLLMVERLDAHLWIVDESTVRIRGDDPT